MVQTHRPTSPHWFVGDGMIHGIEISEGKANWYRNRYVRTPMYANPDTDRMELYLDMEKGGFDYNVSVANTSVIGHGGRKYLHWRKALSHMNSPHKLKPSDPMTSMKLMTAMTAHPKICGETGEF